MKKWFIFFAAFGCALAICYASYLYLYRAEFTSQILTKIYKTPVKVDRIRVTSSDLEFQNIEIYNPTEYATQPALQISKVKIKIPIYSTLFALLDITPFSVRKVSIIDPTVSYETIGDKNNWSELLTNLANAQKSTRCYYIETLVIEDMAIEIRNKELHKHAKRPKSINNITLAYNEEAAPETPSNLIFYATKLALSQIPEIDPKTLPESPKTQNPFEVKK